MHSWFVSRNQHPVRPSLAESQPGLPRQILRRGFSAMREVDLAPEGPVADCRKGNRPSFVHAEDPARAEKMYDLFVTKLRETGVKVETGDFGACMQVHLINDGPVTIILDSRK